MQPSVFDFSVAFSFNASTQTSTQVLVPRALHSALALSTGWVLARGVKHASYIHTIFVPRRLVLRMVWSCGYLEFFFFFRISSFCFVLGDIFCSLYFLIYMLPFQSYFVQRSTFNVLLVVLVFFSPHF
jgi:hypothetical protein